MGFVSEGGKLLLVVSLRSKNCPGPGEAVSRRLPAQLVGQPAKKKKNSRQTGAQPFPVVASCNMATKRSADSGASSSAKKARDAFAFVADRGQKVGLFILSADALCKPSFMESFVRVKALRSGVGKEHRETMRLWLNTRACPLDLDGMEWSDLEQQDDGTITAPEDGWPEEPVSTATVSKRYVPGHAHTTEGKTHAGFAEGMDKRYAAHQATVCAAPPIACCPCVPRRAPDSRVAHTTIGERGVCCSVCAVPLTRWLSAWPSSLVALRKFRTPAEDAPASAPSSPGTSASASAAHAETAAPARGTTADMAAGIVSAAATPAAAELVKWTSTSGQVVETDVPKLGYTEKDIAAKAQRVRDHTLLTDRFVVKARAYKDSGKGVVSRDRNLLAAALDAIKLRKYKHTRPALVTNKDLRLGKLHERVSEDLQVHPAPTPSPAQPAQPSPAQPSPAQPSPARPSPAASGRPALAGDPVCVRARARVLPRSRVQGHGARVCACVRAPCAHGRPPTTPS